jgi:hypothetical protein
MGHSPGPSHRKWMTDIPVQLYETRSGSMSGEFNVEIKILHAMEHVCYKRGFSADYGV